MFRVLVLSMVLVFGAALEAHAFEQADVTAFCAEKDRKIPAEGKRLDGKPVEAALMDLKPGKYTLAGEGAVELFENGAFILDKPKNAITFRGTDGDDMMSPSALGGCSRGQLSEALGKNNLAIPAATDAVK